MNFACVHTSHSLAHSLTCIHKWSGDSFSKPLSIHDQQFMSTTLINSISVYVTHHSIPPHICKCSLSLLTLLFSLSLSTAQSPHGTAHLSTQTAHMKTRSTVHCLSLHIPSTNPYVTVRIHQLNVLTAYTYLPGDYHCMYMHVHTQYMYNMYMRTQRLVMYCVVYTVRCHMVLWFYIQFCLS